MMFSIYRLFLLYTFLLFLVCWQRSKSIKSQFKMLYILRILERVACGSQQRSEFFLGVKSSKVLLKQKETLT